MGVFRTPVVSGPGKVPRLSASLPFCHSPLPWTGGLREKKDVGGDGPKSRFLRGTLMSGPRNSIVFSNYLCSKTGSENNWCVTKVLLKVKKRRDLGIYKSTRSLLPTHPPCSVNGPETGRTRSRHFSPVIRRDGRWSSTLLPSSLPSSEVNFCNSYMFCYL